MNGREFILCLSRIIGEQDAALYAKRIGDLDAPYPGSAIMGYEALAFYTYSTGMNWHAVINGELWSGKPTAAVSTFAAVLNGALEKLPVYSDNERLVYRGLQAEKLAEFLGRYVVGSKIWFPAFTSGAFKETSAYNGNVLFTIRSLTARAIWYLAASFDYHEHEILIPAGRSFVVVAVEERYGRAVIVLDEQP